MEAFQGQARPAILGGEQEEEAVRRASVILERSLITVRGALVGSVAAQSHPRLAGAANYDEIFLRDNVPVMVWLLLQRRFVIVRHFLETCLLLQNESLPMRGVFPISFVEQQGELLADYGQRSIGRISSVDASLWWPVLCWLYVKRSRDIGFATSQAVQRGVQRLLDLVMQPSFQGTPVLFVPDCAFMIDRPMDVWGAPLEVEVLLFGCLKACWRLMELAQRQSSSRLLDQRLLISERWQHELRRYLLQHYWLTTRTVEVLRRRPTEQHGVHQRENEFNVQPQVIPAWLQQWLANRGGYLIGNMRTGRPDFRFFSLGNALACLFGLLTPPQQRALFRLVLHNRSELIAEMPLRICHPPLSAEEWRHGTGSDPKNWPGSYHNGGHWPSLLWFFAWAVLLHQQRHPGADQALMQRMHALVEECHAIQVRQLPRQQWAEYFDGPTGCWVGQQSRTYQTWTVVGFLLLHRLLQGQRQDIDLLDLDHAEIGKR